MGNEVSNSTISNSNSSLPQGWQWIRLEGVLELHDNGLWGSHDPVSGIPVIRSVNFCNDGSISTGDIARVQPSTQNTQDKRLRKGDILLERSGGGPKQPVGRVALFDLDEEFYFGNFISRFRCKPDVDSSFLFFQLFNIYMKGGTLLLQDQTTGIRNLRFTEYLQLPIALPPLPEQKRIAAKVQELLTEIERARTACKAQLEAAKALPSSYLRQVFESEEAKKWERKKLGEVCGIIMGQSPPGHTYNKGGMGLPFFQGKVDFGEIYPTPSTWCTEPKKIAKPDDILISVRAPVGPTNLCNGKSCIGRGLAAIRSKGSMDSQFILFFLRFIEGEISKIGQGSTFGAIKREHLQGIRVSLPPTTDQQRRIALELKEKMTQAEKLKAAIEKQLEAINALPQTILRKAFRGEL